MASSLLRLLNGVKIAKSLSIGTCIIIMCYAQVKNMLFVSLIKILYCIFSSINFCPVLKIATIERMYL